MNPLLLLMLIVIVNLTIYWVFYGNKKLKDKLSFLEQDLCAGTNTNHCKNKFEKKFIKEAENERKVYRH